MTEKCPLSREQKEAKEYCLFHPLERPPLRWSKAASIVSATEIAISTLSYLLSSETGTFLMYYFIGNLSVFILTGKHLLIGLVKLYQHYAPEEIRRKCLYKPTCSEYAILALEKYGLIKGSYKTYIRLFRMCRGIEYGIDYP
ncbi:membrane protein insertion efficiency factor YidD [uncultured Bacteroides sp.]|uniref:membrane protein insertion efficiency factor YidD n=1 Tax=uncultured Bacteroides sp. TaxID=162156 RepID=UPI0025FC41FF|nr:membrane protein insertion efficiency factor YidD [uncultured Bacteroides sp.]